MKALWNKGLSKMAQDSFLINSISDKCIFETYQDSSLKTIMRKMSSKNLILVDMKSIGKTNLNKKSIFFNYFFTAKQQRFTWNNARVLWISWTRITYCHDVDFTYFPIMSLVTIYLWIIVMSDLIKRQVAHDFLCSHFFINNVLHF